MRFKLTVEYDGTDFVGWQRQANGPSVQATIEDALTEMHGGAATTIRGAGRTDAGVHALGQVAHFDAPATARIPPLGYQRGLNAVLPRSIAILGIEPVADDFDARFSARGKLYRYSIWTAPVRSPLRDRAVWHLRRALDVARMQEARRPARRPPRLLGVPRRRLRAPDDHSHHQQAGARPRRRALL